MKVDISKPQKSEITLTIEVEESELNPFFERAVKTLAQNAKIAGFRKGKAPREIIEKQFGKEALRAQALESAIPDFYAKAVIQEKVQAIARPSITILSSEPFKFEAKVAILPEVKVKDVDKIKIDKPKVDLTEKEVNETIDYLRKQMAENKEVERAAKKGDRVEMDFEGFDLKTNEPLKGTASKNHPAVLGEGGLIPGFEEEVEGMKPGEEKSFEITFPKDYHSKEFKGKKVKFKVKVHKVFEVKLPEITEEWIESVMGKKMNEKAFRAEVKQNLEKQRDANIRQKRETDLFDAILKNTTVEIPTILIEEELDFILDRLKMEIESKGLKWDQYLKYLESEKKDLRAERREQAEKQVELRLALQHLVKEKGIEVSEKELDEKITETVEQYPENQREQAKAYFSKGQSGHVQMVNRLKIEKLVDDLLS